jgi:head-tail adaptor
MRSTRIRAGELRTPLMLAAPVVTRDPAGGQSTAYPGELQVFAKIEPSGGREWMNAVMLRDQIDTAVTIRYMPGTVANSTWRLRDPNAGTIYTVVAVLVDAKHNLVEMACQSTVGNI